MSKFVTFESVSDLQVSRLVMNLVDPLVDAGDTAQAIHAAIDSLDSVEIATFESDSLFDYRAQRPIVSYVDGLIVDVQECGMALSLVTDVVGERFLYLHGQEPDFHWPSLTQDILEIIERFGIEHVYSFAGMPAPVPHTRPADMLVRTTQHQENPSVVYGSADHYGALSDYMEFKAGQAGIKVTNIRVRVPLYMARGDSPFFAGALAAIKLLATLEGPTLPLGDLEQLADQQAMDLSALVVEGSDFAGLLSRLEEEYDRIPSEAGFVKSSETSPEIPTSDEIGRAAETFLALRDRDPLENGATKNKAPETSDFRSHIVDNIGRAVRRGRHHWRFNSNDNEQPEAEDNS